MPKKKRSVKTGLPPGSLIHIGEKKSEHVRIRILDYDENQFEEKEARTIEECFPFKDKPTTTWINIDGLHQVDIIEKIGNKFGFHPLLLEDILNTEQRPKIEDFETHIYIVLKMLYYNEKTHNIDIEQISIIFGHNFVISFQEKEGNIFDPIRERIRTGKGRTRKMGADYLSYSLVDFIVDSYFSILEKLGENIEDVEETMITNPKPATLHGIHCLKRKMISLRKSVWPLRDVLSALERSDSALIQEQTRIYLKDVYDHTIQVIDTIETYRDVLSGMLDVYLSSISNKMNEIMKVLTIIATIFIPLTFIAGVYGMNFEFMPELRWRWGYPAVWIVMTCVGISMLVYFRKKKWI
ncbi:MAG: magnesium/cobalt transporter CorA [Candidatus Methanoperedens sp.]|nr:magnesium/cobalt transporter CorA [Candidatus Methanoperedens sp.]